MGKIIFSMAVVLLLMGCASGPVTVSSYATGGPGVLAQIYENIVEGPIPTTPGGFIVSGFNPNLGAITHDGPNKKDVYIYTRQQRRDSPTGFWEWSLYRGEAWVKTPEGWRKVTGLEAIHFESAFMQSVTIRTTEGGVTSEIKFDTHGFENRGNRMERVNRLFIILPQNEYQLQIFEHSGELIFKRVKGYPYTRYLNLLHHSNGRTVGGYWVGWEINL